MDIRSKHFFYLSNILSLSRIVLTLPIIYLIKLNTGTGNIFLAAVIGIAILTDYFDGYFSRKLNQATDLGKILDPVADKLAMAVILIALVIYRAFPLPMVILLIYRDLIILSLGLWAVKKINKIPESNYWGRVNTSVVSLTGFLFIIDVPLTWLRITLIICYATIIISGISYFIAGEKSFVQSQTTKHFVRIVVAVLSLMLIYFLLRYEEIYAFLP
jgi:CDP-diacylglycerol--glycerol-3-phosphate 3-phosphatidyltransferase